MIFLSRIKNAFTHLTSCRWFFGSSILSLILFGFPGLTTAAVFDAQGRDAFGNLVVDSSLGDLTFQQAMTIANYLDTVDPKLYGLTFSQDATDYYLSNSGINQTLVEKDKGGSLLSSIFGPNKQSQYTFTGSGQECSGSRSQGGSLPQTCLEFIPDAQYIATTNTLATVVQVTTISNTFNRPTAQFQREIGRFTQHSLNGTALNRLIQSHSPVGVVRGMNINSWVILGSIFRVVEALAVWRLDPP